MTPWHKAFKEGFSSRDYVDVTRNIYNNFHQLSRYFYQPVKKSFLFKVAWLFFFYLITQRNTGIPVDYSTSWILQSISFCETSRTKFRERNDYSRHAMNFTYRVLPIPSKTTFFPEQQQKKKINAKRPPTTRNKNIMNFFSPFFFGIQMISK